MKSDVSSILTKLGLRDRAQTVVFAYESGLAKAASIVTTERYLGVRQNLHDARVIIWGWMWRRI